MHTLPLHNVPQDLYQYLQRLAFIKNRSLDAEVIRLLYKFKQQEETREQQARILADIYHSRVALDAPESLALLREDRAR